MEKRRFLLEIVTPEKVVFSEEVEAVVVPAIEGELGILAGHTPLLTQLGEGEVKVRKNGQRFFLSIGGGFLEVSQKKALLLVTRAVRAEELNEKLILEAKKRAEEILKKKPEGEERKMAQALLRSSLIDLKVLRRVKKRPQRLPES